MKKAAVVMANGTETIEALAPVDALRRGGVEVTLVSCEDALNVVTAQGVTVAAETLIPEVDFAGFDLLVVPGGSGVATFKKCALLKDALVDAMNAGRLVGAICAGPTVLNEFGLLEGRKVTCYPGCEEGFPAGSYQNMVGIVRDGNLITGSGPGCALDFGIALLQAVMGDHVATDIANGMLVYGEQGKAAIPAC